MRPQSAADLDRVSLPNEQYLLPILIQVIQLPVAVPGSRERQRAIAMEGLRDRRAADIRQG
jgi:hypothetical protein